MQKEQFEKLVDEGIKRIPEKLLAKLKNVAIVVEDEPSDAQRRKIGLDKHGSLLGLYEGVPQAKRGAFYSALPDKITIFQKPIEQFASSDEEIAEMVCDTVWHEIAHHFGFEEEEVRRIERARKKGK
jgi:predicted Zn-dependent protease with MMP-like domain